MSLTDTRVVPRFGMQALTNEPLTVQGDGSQRRTMCFVDDILNGFELVITRGTAGHVYNLGSDQSLTIMELARSIIRLTDSQSAIVSVPRPAHDHSRRMPDLAKIAQLGWHQTVSLDDGLRRTIDYFKSLVPGCASESTDNAAPALETLPAH